MRMVVSSGLMPEAFLPSTSWNSADRLMAALSMVTTVSVERAVPLMEMLSTTGLSRSSRSVPYTNR